MCITHDKMAKLDRAHKRPSGAIDLDCVTRPFSAIETYELIFAVILL